MKKFFTENWHKHIGAGIPIGILFTLFAQFCLHGFYDASHIGTSITNFLIGCAIGCLWERYWQKRTFSQFSKMDIIMTGIGTVLGYFTVILLQ